MKTLYAPTEDIIKTEASSLLADSAVGNNVTLSVADNNGIALNSIIVIGYFGQENTEMTIVNSVVALGTSIQVNTLLFPHKQSDPITVLSFNQRKFYGTTVPGGSYTELTGDGSPKNIQVDDSDGATLEYSGSVYNYFKATYFNSITNTESDINDADEINGDSNSRYCSLFQIRKQAGLTNNPRINDGRIEEKRKQAENEINSAIFSRYTLPLAEVPALITRIATLLGGGYLDYEEYGSDGQGVKWLGEARAILKAIANGTQRLIGVNGTELAFTSSSNQVQGYPNVPYDSSDPDSPVQSFTRGMKF